MSMQLEEPRYADRSERAKLRVSGPQRLWFLHQVLTQSFEDMRPGDARDAAMITAHGRMTGYLEAVATEDAVLCHFEPELREGLIAEIRRYVFATQVELDDVTEEMGLVLVAGAGRATALDLVPGAVVHPSDALGIEAAYLWVERAEVPAVLAALDDAGFRPVPEDELEAVRVAHGRPRWGREMDAKTFPQEAAIDGRAVHYDKGCYLGQEAMAKIHFRGKVNRRLRRLEAAGALRPGSEVVLGDRVVGRVTSAANGRALAVLRHTVEAGAVVVAGGVEATVVG
jgi:tRNA-modifying protein YgfZ